jgi:hypothetical protein
VDLLVSTLGRMDCILGMEFSTQNNVLIEGHNRLVKIQFKSRIVWINHALYVKKPRKENAWEVMA